MADFNWDEHPEVKTDQPSFDWNQFEAEKPQVEGPSELESGLRGAAQGASLGFADELTGGGEAFLDWAKGSDKDLSDLYTQHRDESRANYHAAEEANPGSYMTGQVGGSLATAFVPGLNLAKGASLANTAGKLALQGGLSSLGSSEANDVSGLAKDTVKGVGAGLIAGGAGHKIGQVANKVAPKIAGAVEGVNSFAKDKVAPLLDKAGTAADVGSLAYGAVSGDWKPAGTVMTARRLGGGAATKIAGVAMNKLPDMLRAAPETFGKYAAPLMSAMQRGGTSLGATHYVLQSTDPEYRKMLEGMQDQK